jgi:TolA-binding protein
MVPKDRGRPELQDDRYAYRFQGQYQEAEQAFQKYIELIPNDPNP